MRFEAQVEAADAVAGRCEAGLPEAYQGYIGDVELLLLLWAAAVTLIEQLLLPS